MIEEGKRESKDERRGADGSKETVPSDGVEQEVVDSFDKKGCRTLGAVEAQENLPSKVVDTERLELQAAKICGNRLRG